MVFEPQAAWPEGADVRVALSPGARSTWYLPMLSGRQWSFHIAEPSLVYLAPQPPGARLFQWNLMTGIGQALSGAAGPGMDYDLGGQPVGLVYLTPATGAGQSVHSLSLESGRDQKLLDCPESECDQIAVSPDGAWLALETAAGTGGAGSVWVAPADGARPARRLGEPGHVLRRPLWSPTGRLAVYDATDQSTLVLDGPSDFAVAAQFADQLGAAAAWTPDGQAMVFPEIVFVGELATPAAGASGAPAYFSHLYRHGVDGGPVTDLSGAEDELTEDASPAYSPDGRWIAFARRSLDPAHLTLGRQIWLMRADGSQARRLTSQPVMNYSSFAWRPDSSAVAFVQSDMVDPTQPPRIGWLEVATGQVHLLDVAGYEPRWLP